MLAIFWMFSKEHKAGTILKAFSLAQPLEFPFASFHVSLQAEQDSHLRKCPGGYGEAVMGTCAAAHLGLFPESAQMEGPRFFQPAISFSVLSWDLCSVFPGLLVRAHSDLSIGFGVEHIVFLFLEARFRVSVLLVLPQHPAQSQKIFTE